MDFIAKVIKRRHYVSTPIKHEHYFVEELREMYPHLWVILEEPDLLMGAVAGGVLVAVLTGDEVDDFLVKNKGKGYIKERV